MSKKNVANALHIAKSVGRRGYAWGGIPDMPSMEDPSEWLEMGGAKPVATTVDQQLGLNRDFSSNVFQPLTGQPGGMPNTSGSVQNNRISQLQESAQRIKSGEGSAEEHADLVNQYKPVTPYNAPVAPATSDEMAAAFAQTDSRKIPKIGLPSQVLQEGDPAAVRLDIPSYNKANPSTWTVSVHEPKPDYSAGPVIGYDSVAHLSNPTFGVQPTGAMNIAAGKPKSTIATVQGNWKPTTPNDAYALAKQIHNDPNWAQVGMDPERHAYFYDRKTMQPVVSADEALHIGPLVYAKNPVYGDPKNYKFAHGGMPLARASGGRTYHLEPQSEWKDNSDYKKTGGKMTHMAPGEFLKKVEPLDMGSDDRAKIKKFKKKIKKGKPIDHPMAIYPAGGQDGRHHAMAAKELGIKSVPVLTWPKKAKGGTIVDKALMLLSQKAQRQRGRP